jgi:hypothetical protein
MRFCIGGAEDEKGERVQRSCQDSSGGGEGIEGRGDHESMQIGPDGVSELFVCPSGIEVT